MKRLLIAVLGSLIAVALIAPAAQAATQVRHFHGNLSPVGLPLQQQSGGEFDLDAIFKNTRAHKKRFTPRRVSLFHLEDVPLFCMTSPSGYTTTTSLTTTEAPLTKLRKSPRPRKPKVRPYRFGFAFNATTFTGTIEGKIYKRLSVGDETLRGNGDLRVDFFDSGSGVTDCSSDGVRGWGF